MTIDDEAGWVGGSPLAVAEAAEDAEAECGDELEDDATEATDSFSAAPWLPTAISCARLTWANSVQSEDGDDEDEEDDEEEEESSDGDEDEGEAECSVLPYPTLAEDEAAADPPRMS